MLNIFKRRTVAEKLINNYNKLKDNEFKDTVLLIQSEIKHMSKKGIKSSYVKIKCFEFKENMDRLNEFIKTNKFMKDFNIKIDDDPKWYNIHINISLKE